jgi:hypothetical protein
MARREQSWEGLNDADYRPLTVARESHAPFEDEAINRHLLQQGYVYNSGLGIFNKPHFFLGTLHDQFQRGDITILISSEELARDLVAPPAMTRNGTIFISRQSTRRHVWEKIEEWQWRGAGDSALSRALAQYGELSEPERLLDAVTEQEVEVMILHELGENAAHRLLGENWRHMLASLSHGPALYARAVKDHLADCLVTLPTLLQQQLTPCLHFYFTNFSGMRKTIFPALLKAYNSYLNTNSYDELLKSISSGQQHWAEEAEWLLNTYFDKGDEADAHIQQRMASKYPL